MRPPALPLLPHLDPRRILLIKPTALGDVVHTIPVLVKLRQRFPEARIDWLITPENAELVRAHPALSNVVLFDRRAFRRNRWAALRQTLRLLLTLRRTRYDLVIDLHGQLRSAIFALATGAPIRIGFARPVARPQRADGPLRHGWAGAREGSWLAYTHRIPIRTLQVHALERYLWVGDFLGFEAGPPVTRLHLPPEAEARARELLAPRANRPLAVLAPGTMWETKHWRIEGFAELAARLVAAGWSVAIAGTVAESPLARRILAAAPEARDWCGRTTPAELAAILGQAQVCVSNDSGAMHMAAAMGTPVVPIFGPTDPVQVGPYGQAEHVVRAGVECSPCNLRRLSQCPNGHACMQLVTAGQVWDSLSAIVPENRAARPANPAAGAIPSTNPIE